MYLGYTLLRDIAQMHQQTTNSVLARGYEHPFALVDRIRHNVVPEVRNGPLHAVLQAFGFGQFAVEHWPLSLKAADKGLRDRPSDIRQILHVSLIVSGIKLGK